MAEIDLDWAPCYADPWRGIAHFDGITIEADPVCSARPDFVLPCVEDEQIYFCRLLRRICDGEARGKQAIDLGTGSGVLAVYAASMGMTVTGVDINPRALRFARHNLRRQPLASRQRVEFVECDYLDAQSMQPYIARFDYALLNPPFGLRIDNRRLPVAIDGGLLGQEMCGRAVDAAHALLKDDGKLFLIQLLLVDGAGNPLEISLPSGKWRDLRFYPAYHRPFPLKDFISGIVSVHAGQSVDLTSFSDRYLSLAFVELCKGRGERGRATSSIVRTNRIAIEECAWEWQERMLLHRAASQGSPSKGESRPSQRKFQALSLFLESTHGEVPGESRSNERDLTRPQEQLDAWIRANGFMGGGEEFSCLMVEYAPWHLARNRLHLRAEQAIWSSRPDARPDEALRKIQEAIRTIHSEKRSVFRHDGLSAEDSRFWQNASDLVLEYNLPATEVVPSGRSLGTRSNPIIVAGNRQPLEEFHVRFKNPAVWDCYDRDLKGVAEDFVKVMLHTGCISPTGCFYYMSVPMPLAKPADNEGGTGAVYAYAWAENPWLLRREALVADLARFAYFLYNDLTARETREELKRRQEASARAVVFARNFSHVVGSHVVSNPSFQEALVGSSIGRFRDLLERSQQRIATVCENYPNVTAEDGPWPSLKRAEAILNDAGLELRTGGALAESSRRFHEYLQGRFDFIARAIDETKDEAEPVFFVADLLGGFLKQSAFLDTFVADLGLRLPEIEIVVSLPVPGDPNRSEDFRVSWHQENGTWTHGWDKDKNPASHDLLVGLPGGMVSAHAFYSLLENVIRNSVKYRRRLPTGSAEAGRYELRLELRFCERHGPRRWRLALRDNFEPENLPAARETIRRLLAPEFILDDGSQRREGLGLLEMQACSMALLGTTEQNLAEVGRNGESSTDLAPLTYELELNRPLLLAVVSENEPSWVKESDQARFFTSIKELADSGRGSHIVVIDGSVEAFAKQLEDRSLRFTLPYRLLVLHESRSPGDGARLGQCSDRRVQCCQDSILYRSVFGDTLADEAEVTVKDLKQGERRILDCYAAWLRSWKRHELDEENGWHLWVGLERSPKQLQEAWRPLESFRTWQGFERPLVHVKARAFERDASDSPETTVSTSEHPADTADSEEIYWAMELDAPRYEAGGTKPKKCLVFDNHGQCFPRLHRVEKEDDLRAGTRFYQTVTGSQTPDLFRLLSRPPSSPFAFVFFIYSLVESCLADVALVDERLAADLLFASNSTAGVNPRFRQDLGEHQKAGVFPVFGVRHATSQPMRYSSRHDAAFTDQVSGAAASAEGIALSDGEVSIGLLTYDRERRGFRTVMVSDAEIRCDALVIHEGVLDLIGHEIQWPSRPEEGDGAGALFDELMLRLLELSPSIIRMSGRGRHTKHFRRSVPFIEFSEVSSSILTGRNKFALVRGLFGAAGEAPEPGQ